MCEPRLSPSSAPIQKATPTLLAGLLPLAVDQLGEVGRAHQPRRLLPAKPEDPARKQLGGRTPAGFVAAQAEVLRRDFLEWDVGFAELGEKAEEAREAAGHGRVS